MSLKKEILAQHEAMKTWRHHIHAHPETAFEEFGTADFVADKLNRFGIEVHRGLAKTGVVGVLKSGSSSKKIGLRADLDALNIDELNNVSYRSTHKGKMHACGHDGHMTMLLGAAEYLAKTKRFSGTAYFIFQPAEENHAGGKVMVDEGLFQQFPATAVYGMHNQPGIPAGKFGVMPGPIMAAADFFEIKIIGSGTHGATPHKGLDPVAIGSEVVLALQQIVSRNIDPFEQAVVSVTQFNAGHATNVIPETAILAGTTRSFNAKIQDFLEKRIRKIATGVAEAHGAKIEIKYESRYCPTINHPAETERAAVAAVKTVGDQNVLRGLTPMMASEDFGWMLRAKPGCFVWLGNGDGDAVGSCMVHNPKYDFNDEILPIGASFWANLVEQELCAE